MMADIESMFYQVRFLVCLKSVATEELTVVLVKSLRDLCAEVGFTLTKWVSNSRRVLSSIPAELRASDLKDLSYKGCPAQKASFWCTMVYRR